MASCKKPHPFFEGSHYFGGKADRRLCTRTPLCAIHHLARWIAAALRSSDLKESKPNDKIHRLHYTNTPPASEKPQKCCLKYREYTLGQGDMSGINFQLQRDRYLPWLNVHGNKIKRGRKASRKEDVLGILRHFTCKRRRAGEVNTLRNAVVYALVILLIRWRVYEKTILENSYAGEISQLTR